MMGYWLAMSRELKNNSKLRRLKSMLKCDTAECVGILYLLWCFAQSGNANEEGFMAYVTLKDIENYMYGEIALIPAQVVDALVQCGFLDLQEDGISVHDWYENQKYWIQHSRKVKSDAARYKKNRSVGSSAEEQSELFGECEEDASPTKEYPEQFVKFWQIYPRRDEKSMAFKQYKARINDGYSEDEIIKAAEMYAIECQNKCTPKEYIKKAKTFLGVNTPFVDYLEKTNTASYKQEGNPFE